MEQNNGWANPGPWVLESVAVLTGCAGFVFAGLVPPSTVPLLAGVLFACVLSQLLGGLIALRKGDIVLGTISGLFGTVITIGAALTLWQQVFLSPQPGAFTPEVMGVFWFVLFILCETLAVAFGKVSWIIFLGIAEVGISFLFLSIGSWTGSPSAFKVAGWLLIIFAAFCSYMSAAILWAEQFKKVVIPIGKPLFK